MAVLSLSAQAPPGAINVDISGRLEAAPPVQSRPAAFQVHAIGMAWHVDPRGPAPLLRAAASLAGGRVVARGTVTRAPAGVQPRLLLTLSAITAAGAEGARERVTVTARGTLRTGVMAIGGESTGVTLTAAGITWELQLQERDSARAASLDGAFVEVAGELRRQAGVELRERFILDVRKLTPAAARRGAGRPAR